MGYCVFSACLGVCRMSPRLSQLLEDAYTCIEDIVCDCVCVFCFLFRRSTALCFGGGMGAQQLLTIFCVSCTSPRAFDNPEV